MSTREAYAGGGQKRKEKSPITIVKKEEKDYYTTLEWNPALATENKIIAHAEIVSCTSHLRFCG